MSARSLLLGAGVLLLAGQALAQLPPPGTGSVLPKPVPADGSAGVRYLEACEQAAQQGLPPPPGCANGIYRPDEIEQLKRDALRTRNAQLMTMVGDAYQQPRGGLGDMSQAYRWYVLAAVRGDPQAMVRLSDMYRSGQGAPQDKVKALGYARLSQKMAPPGSTEARRASQSVRQLSSSMAGHELAMAERFAGELEQQLGGRGGAPVPLAPARAMVPGQGSAAGGMGAMPAPGTGIPGLGGAALPFAGVPVPSVPAAAVPGLPGTQGMHTVVIHEPAPEPAAPPTPDASPAPEPVAAEADASAAPANPDPASVPAADATPP